MATHTLKYFKQTVQNIFVKNDDALHDTGVTTENQLKAHLIESNFDKQFPKIPEFPEWRLLDDTKNWYYTEKNEFGEIKSLFLDTSRERVWILYSLINAKELDTIVSKWSESSGKLDKCWLSRNQLLSFEKLTGWEEKGIGLKFNDVLANDDFKSSFSLKAWYTPQTADIGLKNVLEKARESYAIDSIRWQKKEGGSTKIASEWYSHGKITINRAEDIDDVMLSISMMADKYEDSLLEATKLRDSKMNAFEFNFSKDIDLNAFSEYVSKGRTQMNLWLAEVESHDDFKRFRGVDLHTWDPIFLDIGLNYAYLTVPGKGCVNAAPRIATIQGQETAGKTNIYFDGVEIFD